MSIPRALLQLKVLMLCSGQKEPNGSLMETYSLSGLAGLLIKAGALNFLKTNVFS